MKCQKARQSFVNLEPKALKIREQNKPTAGKKELPPRETFAKLIVEVD